MNKDDRPRSAEKKAGSVKQGEISPGSISSDRCWCCCTIGQHVIPFLSSYTATTPCPKCFQDQNQKNPIFQWSCTICQNCNCFGGSDEPIFPGMPCSQCDRTVEDMEKEWQKEPWWKEPEGPEEEQEQEQEEQEEQEQEATSSSGGEGPYDPHFVRSVKLGDISGILKFLSKCKQPFEASQLYNSGEKRKFEDPSLRRSEFRAIVDPDLFDLADHVVQSLSDDVISFSLVRNDCTHIRYREGGFFKRHQDFLSLNSNCIEEYTLILCVTPNDVAELSEGGKTVIHHGPGKLRIAYDATTMPGYALLFRKDLEHEGQMLTKGEKHILNCNVWGSRMYSGQVLNVRFPIVSMKNSSGSSNSSDSEYSSNSSDSKYSSGSSGSNTRHSYALAVEQIKGTMLETYVEWQKRQLSKVSETEIFIYDCKVCSFEEFETIFRVLTYQHITETSIIAAQPLLDYFGPIPRVNILVENSPVNPAAAAKEYVDYDYFDVDFDNDDFDFVDKDIIVCESAERTAVVAKLARCLGLPYVPFRMVLVEGSFAFVSGDFAGDNTGDVNDDVRPIPMTTVWATIGEHEHILVMRDINATKLKSYHHGYSEPSIRELYHIMQNAMEEADDAVKATHEKYASGDFIINGGRCTAAHHRVVYHHGGPKTWERHRYPDDTYAPLGMLTLVEHVDKWRSSNGNISNIFNGQRGGQWMDDKFLLPDQCVYLPDDQSSHSLGDDASNLTEDGTWLFHRDSSGKTCFTKAEARAASEHICVKLDLEAQVLESLNSVKFQLAQQSIAKEDSAYFCNESVYGELNILEVTGVLRLQKDDQKPNAPDEKLSCDAWPTEEQFMHTWCGVAAELEANQ